MSTAIQKLDGWNWNDLRLFLSVARSGRLTDTAAFLGISISTVARRLAHLERDLGLSLFLRSQSGYALTMDGHQLMQKAELVETAMFGVHRLADAVATRGHVRLALPEGLAVQLVLPNLAAFQAAHPAIALDLITGPFSLDLMRRESDIALRLVKPTDNDLLLRKLGRMGHAIYAAKKLTQKQALSLPKLSWPAEMHRLPIAEATASWIAMDKRAAKDHHELSLNSLRALMSAAGHGLGSTLLPCFMGDAEPGLRRIAGPAGFFSQDIYLVLHRDLRHNPRVRAVTDFLVALLTSARHRLSGIPATLGKEAEKKAGSQRKSSR